MKRHAIHGIILLLASTVLMASCQSNGGRNGHSKDAISVVVENDELTKAGASRELFSIPVQTEEGDTLVIKGVITDFDSAAPQTRAAALTTGNIADAIGSTGFKLSAFKDGAVYAYDSFDIDETHEHIEGKSMGNIEVTYGAGAWEMSGGPYYWPLDKSSLTFCSYVPSSSLNVTGWNGGSKASFHLAQHHDAEEGHDAYFQDDILFAIDNQSAAQSSSARIRFKHALTGVQFVRGNIKGCTITSISLENFYAAGDGEYTADSCFTWKNLSDKTTFTQKFNKTISASETGKISLDNSGNGSRTFMIIPQKLSTDAVIRIDIEDRLHPIAFKIGQSAEASLNDWSSYAGKILVLTVDMPSSNYTGVKIEVGSNDDATVATNASVTNTNYSDVYIRANIIANWVSYEDEGVIMSPILGSEIAFEFAADFYDYWFYDAESETYYYKYPVPSGEPTACNLFERYARPVKPDYSKHNLPDDGRIELIIASQAVEADAAKEKVTAAGWNAAAIAWMSSTRKN